MSEEKQKKMDAIKGSLECVSYLMDLVANQKLTLGTVDELNKCLSWLKHIEGNLEKDLNAEEPS